MEGTIIWYVFYFLEKNIAFEISLVLQIFKLR